MRLPVLPAGGPPRWMHSPVLFMLACLVILLVVVLPPTRFFVGVSSAQRALVPACAGTTLYPPSNRLDNHAGKEISQPSNRFDNHAGKEVLRWWGNTSSAHVCVGTSPIEIWHGAHYEAAQVHMPASQRMCTVRNLCVRDGTFVYFRDAAHPLPFLYSNVRGGVFEPPSPLTQTGLIGNLVVVAEDGPIPPDYFFAEEGPVHVVATRRIKFAVNPGHELADGTWPHFHTMLELGMLALDNQVLYTPFSRSHEPAARSHDILSSRAARNLASYPNRTCFPWAISGTQDRSVLSPLPSSSSWRALHDFVLARYKLPGTDISGITSSGIHIVVRHKQTGHTFTNYDHLMSELKRCYPSARTTLFVPETSASLKDEIELLSSATVYITPGGGGSFTSVFVPTSAAVIYGAACWPGRVIKCHDVSWAGVCCVQLERHIWDHAPYMHVSYYNYGGLASAMTSNRTSYMRALDWDYPVETRAMFVLVDRALFLSKGRAYNVCR